MLLLYFESKPFSGHMMKILFIAESVSLAHIGRPLKLTKWAFGAGHEVHFACSKKHYQIEALSNLPFKTHTLECIEPSLFYSRLKIGQFPYTLKKLQQYQKDEITLTINEAKDFLFSPTIKRCTIIEIYSFGIYCIFYELNNHFLRMLNL